MYVKFKLSSRELEVGKVYYTRGYSNTSGGKILIIDNNDLSFTMKMLSLNGEVSCVDHDSPHAVTMSMALAIICDEEFLLEHLPEEELFYYLMAEEYDDIFEALRISKSFTEFCESIQNP